MGILSIIAIISGFGSALCWLKSSVVKVNREQEVERRQAEASKKGIKPNFSGITIDGWDMSGTFRAQARWNSAAAILAALSISAQALIHLFEII